MNRSSDNRFVVRLRGLPYSATDDQIMEFLCCEVVGCADGIRRTFTKEGRPSGEAYVEVTCQEDANACLDKDHCSMGKRYIEVFSSSVNEMEYVLNRSGDGQYETSHVGGFIIRMRGLPYQCTKEEIAQFFSGMEIIPNGIVLPLDDNGRSTGEAYVEFSTQHCAEGALAKHKQKIGHRYIEIFKSNRRELNQALGEYDRSFGRGGRPSPYDRPRMARGIRGGRFGARGGRMGYGGGGGYGGGDYYEDDYEEEDYSWNDPGYGTARYRGRGRGGMKQSYGGGGRNYGGDYNDHYDEYAEDEEYYEDHGGLGSQYVIHLRGLPFKASDDDISNFFSPIVPVRIHREYGRDGRVSGEADVEFASHQDAQAAMQKDGATMTHRYIELFMRGPGNGGGAPPRNMRGGGGGRRRGGRGRGGGRGYMGIKQERY
ncbi:heterogeneous nuclear ribonucleoprotein H2-like isoform X1 [Clavelina lepadiformis]|uniref:heterogeneous nuclear ribonucleoprotein H2-like isoform X1 n=1 Tax=Clavelina lepadiformis TaxID=159417 RepID=UPI0040429ECF